MKILSPMLDPCDHHSIDSSFQQAPVDLVQQLHFSAPLQYPAFERVDLTSYLQFCEPGGFAATMASDQNEVDMETFQRLSDSYQPDVQVRTITPGFF